MPRLCKARFLRIAAVRGHRSEGPESARLACSSEAILSRDMVPLRAAYRHLPQHPGPNPALQDGDIGAAPPQGGFKPN